MTPERVYEQLVASMTRRYAPQHWKSMAAILQWLEENEVDAEAACLVTRDDLEEYADPEASPYQRCIGARVRVLHLLCDFRRGLG